MVQNVPWFNPCIYSSKLNGNIEINHSRIIISPQNQRIELYWSLFQLDRWGWWRRFFQDFVDLVLLNTDDPFALECIHYCFMGIIREELNSVKEEWNSQIIFRSHNSGSVGSLVLCITCHICMINRIVSKA